MVPAVTEIAAIIAVDHSNVLTRRRRSTMKSGVSQFLSGTNILAAAQRPFKPKSRAGAMRAGSGTGRSWERIAGHQRTARARNIRTIDRGWRRNYMSRQWGWSPPKPPATADDSYRKSTVGVRVARGGFLLPARASSPQPFGWRLFARGGKGSVIDD